MRWERDRDAMAGALARHDALIRAAMEARGAYVFKTIGDAFCTVFGTAQQAIAAALDAQRALATADFSAVDELRVRMALHAGNADERDGDYFGPALNRVARLLAIGHGGQVLISNACLELVLDELPPDCSLRDLGEHRLKDLGRPERVHQLIAPDLAADFPPLRSLDHLSNNLPLQLSSFVGREVEIGTIVSLIEQHRLVTLVGSGGVGKTRLSLCVAADLLDGSGDGVWFIELAPLTSGDYIPSTVAQALGLRLPTMGDPVDNLVRTLKEKEMLLVFDNCEHLVESAAHVVSAILRGAPKVKVLASSRQGLGISGEAIYQVPSLDLATGVGLFAERARAASATFSLTGDNAPIIADISRRLDGIPLAIELAAARAKMLSPKQLREHLNERFRVLTGGSRDVLPRQQTLRAAIDWSYDLLDERERVLFRRLGIFAGGFALEGAVAVGSDEGLDQLDLFEALASLVDKSLVLAEPRGDAVRYRLLESTRAYAAEKLDAASERDLLASRHLRYLRDRFVELVERMHHTARSTDFVSVLQTDLEDVRWALDGALARSEAVDGGELLANFNALWKFVGLEAEGIARCETYLAALPAGASRIRARLLGASSNLHEQSGHSVRAFELAREAVEQGRASGDATLLAGLLCHLASQLALLRRFDEAEDVLSQAEAIKGTPASLRIRLLATRALSSAFRGDLETAATILEQLRKEHRMLGNVLEEQQTALSLAEIDHARGQTKRAIEIASETLAAARSGAVEKLLVDALSNLAGYLAAEDDVPGAVAAAREAIAIRAAREPDHLDVAIAIERLALAVARSGDLARAAVLEGYAEGAFAQLGFVREVVGRSTYDRLAPLLRAGVAAGELARLTAEGAALTPEAAVALALEESTPRC